MLSEAGARVARAGELTAMVADLISALEFAYEAAMRRLRAELAAEESTAAAQSERRHRVLAQAVPAAVLIHPTYRPRGQYEFHCPRCKFWRPFGTQQGAVTFGIGHMLNLHPEEGKL